MNGVGASKRYYITVFQTLILLMTAYYFKFLSATSPVLDFMMTGFFLLFNYISLEQMLYWQCHLPCVKLELW